MQCVCASYQVEEVAVGIRRHGDAFAVQLTPGHQLTGNQHASQDERGYRQRECTLGGRTAQSKPFFHYVQLAKDAAARHFHSQAANIRIAVLIQRIGGTVSGLQSRMY